jgi:hypothetical protein
MKSLLMLLLITGTVNCFAQNLGINDLRELIGIETKDSVDSYLTGKGFSYGPKKLDLKRSGMQIGDSWQFLSHNKGGTTVLSSINRWQDSTDKMISYETTNPYFYASLLNQLTKEGFSYQKAIPDESETKLAFSNGPETILIMLQPQTGQYRFQYKRSGDEMVYATRRKRVSAKPAVNSTRATKRAIPAKRTR